MKRKTIASILIIAMAISMLVSGCGNKNKDKNTEKNSEAVSEAETETESEIDTETETESETQVATNNNTETESENKEESKPTHTCDFATLKNDANNHWYMCSCGKTANSGAHNYDSNADAICNTCGYTRSVHVCSFGSVASDANNHWNVCSCGATANVAAHIFDDEYDGNCNVCGYTRSVPERPTVSANPVNWNGGDIYLENVGISIPTLTEFNRKGLEASDKDWWWTGHEDDKTALSAMNRIYLTCDNFADALVSQGWGANGMNAFSVSQNRIWFSWDDGAYEDFSLARYGGSDGGYYELTINQSLKYEDYFGIDVAKWNRDVVKTLISFVSSDVNTVYNAILEDLIGTEQFDGSWKSIGDCKVMFDYDSSYNGHYVYRIKSK